jgi:DNA-directed RNA polymerase subunit RPC12/RpoP
VPRLQGTMKAKPKACSQCNKTFWTKLDHEIRCGRCRAKLLRKRTKKVLATAYTPPEYDGWSE